eukprot:CAMPEP_0181494856 /NCGR_PEP_ID=MMETSP1110-20121109/52043_1 /TAXON_ID=174948 /ORGANISM="Symbiodinium sp., Strain CCMP421" /LENGTH=185 /DNA_ID=CAMNT_0023622393 /DNA_START=20 /DNA_END=575 /DNA_ORIENTATION=-
MRPLLAAGAFKKAGPTAPSSSLIAVLSLDVARDVHEEGDGQQEGLHDVGHIEEAARINLRPLRVVEVELEIAVETHPEEEHGKEGELIRAESLEVADDVGGVLALLDHGSAGVVRQPALELVRVPVEGSLQVLRSVLKVDLLEKASSATVSTYFVGADSLAAACRCERQRQATARPAWAPAARPA